ncbi:MAG: endonuclease MutS2 [Anaerolineaceae bacterium]|nr:endonuclease MutS2 [Anaerolineaceae bacterium]
MDAHALELLEFRKIQEMVVSRATLEATRATIVRELVPVTDSQAIVRRRDRISELVVLTRAGKDFSILVMDDPSQFLHRAHIQDSYLTGRQLRQVLTLLESAANARRFFKTHAADAPLVAAMAEGLVDLPELRGAMAKAIAEDGTVNDDASEELRQIRRQKRTTRNRIEGKLQAILRRPEFRDALAGDRASQRGGRLVLQLKANQWTTVGGLVHDRSHTGQTFYVEPAATIELGNELQNLAAEEESEVRRILLALTRTLRPWLDDLQGSFDLLVQIDMLRAAARLAELRHMIPPTIAARGAALELVEARHPVLESALEGEGHRGRGHLVPLSLRIESDLKALAVTGSNTGGKTVALKTVGLLALMAQAGLHLPARRASLPIFDRVLVDIGDEQSIEQSLSTFSSHMSQIINVVSRATANSLVLLDELGSGTDPAEGGALACAILRTLVERQATAVVTTHLREVKIYCHDQPHMQNAAMEFDTETLQPTFRLVQGEPGASHALAIAGRLGLPAEVLERARAFLSDEHLNLEQLLARITEDRRKLREDLETARRERQAAQAERQQLRQELAEARKERKALLREAYRQASGIVDNTKREMQEVVRRARQHGATGEIERLREKVREKGAGLAKAGRTARQRTRPKARLQQLAVGQRVYVETMRTDGVIESINRRKDRVTVNIRGLAVEVGVGDLSQPEAASGRREQPPRQASARTSGAAAIELNLIGQRVVEAVGRLDRFLDQAVVADYERVTVIHGRGTGALMKAVQDYLGGHPLVESFRPGNETEGGIAVTVVHLKE